eukprot:CAMPEP_0117560194 /NCGR_PEP_ID=MMETSP0784-20121206/53750_1 /TAXON_ID=39447 /ORGANISM="" /LENGTH=200 /DNA_ID=CAMNT_0005357595 /DNA_START=95 /DNA_END=697 /DNA_ORIENTATION=-
MTKLCNTQDIFLKKTSGGDAGRGGRTKDWGWSHDNRSRSPRKGGYKGDAYSSRKGKGRDASYGSFNRYERSSKGKGGKKGKGDKRQSSMGGKRGRKGRDEPDVSVADLDNALEDYFRDRKSGVGGGAKNGKAGSANEETLNRELENYMTGNGAKVEVGDEADKSKSQGILKDEDAKIDDAKADDAKADDAKADGDSAAKA